MVGQSPGQLTRNLWGRDPEINWSCTAAEKNSAEEASLDAEATLCRSATPRHHACPNPFHIHGQTYPPAFEAARWLI